MRRLSSEFRSHLVERFWGWRHDHLRGQADAERLVPGDGSREGVEEVFTLWERFLALDTPEAALQSDGGDRFETLSGQTVYLVERLLNLRPIESEQREAATKQLVLQIEPFVYKLLAVFEPELFRNLAEGNRGLGAGIAKLISTDRIPFDGMSDEAFRSKEGWGTRSSFANALRDIVPARLMTAHQANALTSKSGKREALEEYVEESIDRRHSPLWESCLAVMLGLVDENADDIYEACYGAGDGNLQEPLSGQILNNNYRTGRLIGEGAFGKVFEGVDLSNDKKVAIKFVGEVVDPQEQRQREDRFDMEGRYMSKLQHQNIVHLYRVDRDPECGQYLVMEYVPGVELRELLAEGRLSVAFAIEVAVQICGALAEAHDQGIVHRDLKPENIRLKPQGRGRLQVKIIDFGLALNPEQSLRLSRSGERIGTPFYMSPEQLRGEEVGPRSDLYSLGVVLFEMLAGWPPFRTPEGAKQEGEAFHQVMAQHLNSRPPSLAELQEDLPRDLITLVESLLVKAPSDRPSDAHEVQESLRGTLFGMGHRGSLVVEELGALDSETEAEPEAITDILNRKGWLEPKVGADTVPRPARGSVEANSSRMSSGTPAGAKPEGSQDSDGWLDEGTKKVLRVIAGVAAVSWSITLVSLFMVKPEFFGRIFSGVTGVREMASESAPRDVDLTTSPVWKPGHQWLYRARRRAANSTSDEASALEYYERLAIEGVSNDGSELEVEVRATGGPDEARTDEWVVSEDCIQDAGTGERLFCTGGSYVDTEVDGHSVEAFEWDGARSISRFHPQVGLIEFSRAGRKDWRTRYDMIGFKTRDSTVGMDRHEVYECDWSDTVVEGKPFRALNAARRRRYRAAFELDGLGEDLRSRTVDLSGKGYADRATLLAGEARSLIVLERDGEILGSRRHETATYALRRFVSPKDGAEFVHFVLAEGTDIELVLLHVGKEQAKGLTWQLEREVGKKDYFGAVVVPGLEGCILQFRNRRPDKSRLVANIQWRSGAFEQLSGGSLEPESVERYVLSEGVSR